MTSIAQSATTHPQVKTPWAQHTLLHLVFFLMGAELFVLPPLLSTIVSALGATPQSTAWVATSYVLTYSITTPLLAATTERFNRKSVILAGVGVFALGDLLCSVAPSMTALIAAHAISGLGGALAAPAMWAMLAETAAPDQRGQAVSRGAATFAAGQIVGVPAGTLLAAHGGWRAVFAAVCTGLLLSGALIAVSLRLSTRVQRLATPTSLALKASLSLWHRRNFALTLAITGCAQAARVGAYTYLGVLYHQRFGLSATQLGAIGALVGAGSLTGSLLAGPLIDRCRRRGRSELTLCIPGSLAIGAGLIAGLTTHTLAVSIAAVSIWSAAGAACYSTTQASLSNTVPELRGPAASWNNAAMNGGIAIGTAVLGLVSTNIGIEFIITAVLFAMAACALSATTLAR